LIVLLCKTYLLGKDVVQIFRKEFWKDPDGSVWIDLTDEGLDRKIVLRSDGTVYMTQDIGTAIQRVKDFPRLAEWFTLLVTNKITILRYCFWYWKISFDWSESLYHLSYGMVDLPSGKWKVAKEL
jgi:arginyl-tRNA synthetase